MSADRPVVGVIGGGFTGLAAAYDLARAGARPIVFEAAPKVGGLAASLDTDGEALDLFYHHWFRGDRDALKLVSDLGLSDRVEWLPSVTGLRYGGRTYRLSTPLDVLRFGALGLPDRFRLGLLVFQARRVSEWRSLEGKTAREWLVGLCGRRVFEVVWEPLLVGKFGEYADRISAVWFWNKLVLRGGSRTRDGREILGYYRGSFQAFAEAVAEAIRAAGGEVRTSAAVDALHVQDGRVVGIGTAGGMTPVDAVLATTALPIVADLVEPCVARPVVERLRGIEYLANVCVTLELSETLSHIYWLNVNEPGFPFVGVIEHTNLIPAERYGGRHIVYLSRYLPPTDPLYAMPDEDLVAFSLDHVARMFPAFRRETVVATHVGRARYSQPVVGKHYSAMLPERTVPGIAGLHIASMAQIYPEDRGTNYAIREGRRAAADVLSALGGML